jgi:hypothetical protein
LTVIAGGILILAVLGLWMWSAWRHPDRRSDTDPDDWKRLGIGGGGSS